MVATGRRCLRLAVPWMCISSSWLRCRSPSSGREDGGGRRGVNGQAREAIDDGRGGPQALRERWPRDAAGRAHARRAGGRAGARPARRVCGARCRGARALSEGAPERDPERGDRPGARCVAASGTGPIAVSRARPASAAAFARAVRALVARQHRRRDQRERRDRHRPPVGVRERRSPPRGRWSLRARAAWRRARVAASTTASTAVPSEPPTRWSTLSIGVARGTCQRSSVEYAAAIAGIIVKPRPMPAHDERDLEQPVRRVRRRPG